MSGVNEEFGGLVWTVHPWRKKRTGLYFKEDTDGLSGSMDGRDVGR